jgi:hypothetical protein
LNARRQTSLDEAGFFNGNSGLNVDIIESYGIILALPSLRDHAADDRQAE